MQSNLSSLPVATKVPSGEIAHPYTCKHKQHQTSSAAAAAEQKQRKTYPTRVRFNGRLLDQLLHHHDYHTSRFPFLQPQLLSTHSRKTQTPPTCRPDVAKSATWLCNLIMSRDLLIGQQPGRGAESDAATFCRHLKVPHCVETFFFYFCLPLTCVITQVTSLTHRRWCRFRL